MTFGEILFWILVIILLIILYKISPTAFWVVLIIAIIIFIFRLVSGPIKLETHEQLYDINQNLYENINMPPMNSYDNTLIYNDGLIPDRSTNQAVLNSIM